VASSDIPGALILGAPEPTDEELLVATLEHTYRLRDLGLVFEGTFLGTTLEHPLVFTVVRLALERGVLEQVSLEQLVHDETHYDWTD
jgi:hypothetical protein